MSEREILFRGKRCDNGDWVYGDVAHSIRSENGRKPHKSWIVDGYFSNGGWLTPLMRYAVIDETIGQYTGLTDKNGLTKIFEYDIIDANGRKVGNYYENSNLLKDGTCLLVARMGTKEWSRSELEAIKRGCKYAE